MKQNGKMPEIFPLPCTMYKSLELANDYIDHENQLLVKKYLKISDSNCGLFCSINVTEELA